MPVLTPLIITPEVEAEVLRIRTHAELPGNRRTRANMHSPGDFHTNSVVIPAGFKVVYSIDEGEKPGLWFKHLSVSVTTTGGRTTPTKGAMDILAKLFGFTSRATMGLLPPDADTVVHALEPFDEGTRN